MRLTVWTYEGPTHVGAMRIATSMKDVHYVLHAPQGDTYADLLFTMIERRQTRPPVTYTTFQARDLGGDTADLVKRTLRDAYDRFEAEACCWSVNRAPRNLSRISPAASRSACTCRCRSCRSNCPSYSRKENWGASETFYHIVRAILLPLAPASAVEPRVKSQRPRANVLGPSALGFRCRDDVIEITRLLASDRCRRERRRAGRRFARRHHANSRGRLQRLPVSRNRADRLRLAAAHLRAAVSEDRADRRGRDTRLHRGGRPRRGHRCSAHALESEQSRLPWYSRSVDSTYLTGKRVFVFGDATHVVAATHIAARELGFTVVGVGTYSREFGREVREVAKLYGIDALITDDYLDVEARVTELAPELVLGTQMERHIAKRLGIPCAVISAPCHVQDFPARFSPQMGFEGANVIFDTWVHPLMMGLEEHLLSMFRGDFEFADGAAPSHLGRSEPDDEHDHTPSAESAQAPDWTTDAEQELKKIPFFVRGKARRNTELFARERGVATITVEALYDAKAHFGR